MTEELELAQKRVKTQEEIRVIYKTFAPSLILRFFSRIFYKNLKQDNPVYWGMLILSFNFVMLIPSTLYMIALNDLDFIKNYWMSWVIAVQVGILALLVSRYIMKMELIDVANRLVPKIINIEDLANLENWLRSSWSINRMGGYVGIIWITWVSITVSISSSLQGKFIGYGAAFVTIPTGFLIAISLYYLIWFFFFSIYLGNLRYELNAISPAASEVTAILHTLFTRHLYLSSAFLAIVTYIDFQLKLDAVGIPFLILSWIAVTTQFMASRSTVNKIVDGVKWKTLNKIQKQINQIEETEDLAEKNNNEKLFRLVDTYEKIRITSTNKLDTKAVLTFFSQMMLPLLGLLLGNLEKLAELFSS